MPDKIMSNGLLRFHKYLQALQTALLASENKKNPALYLYHCNARTPLFMLEALTRVYKKIQHVKKFKKLNTQFKQLEDILGAIDYYDNMYKKIQSNINIPGNIKGYLRAKTIENQNLLNTVLIKEKWIGAHNNRINKIAKKLEKIKWLDDEADAFDIEKTYKKFTKKIVKKINAHAINFDDVESDVHELRRELRWLSIYPQSFDGLFAFAPASKTTPVFLQKYLTVDIKKSPFNILPTNKNCTSKILIQKNYFYALSWLIAELGKLKDEGLLIIALKEAVQHIQHLPPQEAEKIAFGFCPKTQATLPQILAKAKEISETFFKEKIIEKLILP